jgi:hypothetical protein
MDNFYQVNGMERIGFAGAGCTTALIHASNGALLAQYHGTTGQCFFIVGMANPNARDGGRSDGLCFHQDEG